MLLLLLLLTPFPPLCLDPIVRNILSRIEYFTESKLEYQEYLQILRYTTGQYYREHHDYFPAQFPASTTGPRVFTFFLYLSDVEQGGETHFPMLDLSVQPKKGRAVVWPSVLNDNPLLKDERTAHEAKAVLSNDVKYAANSWIHLNHFRQPNHWGCTG